MKYLSSGRMFGSRQMRIQAQFIRAQEQECAGARDEIDSREAHRQVGPVSRQSKEGPNTRSLPVTLNNCDISFGASFVISIVGLVVALILAVRVSILLALLMFFGASYIAWAIYRKAVIQKEAEYALEFPSLMLAMAANMKIGLPPFAALERAARLVPKECALRHDVQQLLDEVHQGVSTEEALARFGAKVAIADIILFRHAFALVMEYGGEFAPTLQRLASFSRDRALLIKSLEARTAGMRLTATSLLVLTPLILMMLAARIEGFWFTLLNDPLASAVGFVGTMLILSGYGILRKMGSLRI